MKEVGNFGLEVSRDPFAFGEEQEAVRRYPIVGGRSKPHTSSGRSARGKHRQLVSQNLKRTARGWRFLSKVESK